MLMRQIARLKRMFGWSHRTSARSYSAAASVYFAASKYLLPSWKILSADFWFSGVTPSDHGVALSGADAPPLSLSLPLPLPSASAAGAVSPHRKAQVKTASPSLTRERITRGSGLLVDEM